MKLYKLVKIIRFYEWLINYLPNRVVVYLSSFGRRWFMHLFIRHKVSPQFMSEVVSAVATKTPSSANQLNQPHQNKGHVLLFPRILWGLEFRVPLMNAAGQFKNGEGYDIIAAQGAGGYIGGTSTYNSRIGNIKHGVKLPFLSLPQARTTLNYLGLPNLGDETLAIRSITKNKIIGCPIGWSVMRSPDYSLDFGMECLIKSLWLYHDNLQVDFIEINESCPNVSVTPSLSSVNENFTSVKSRLIYIATEFLSKRKRKLPVIVKFSNDLELTDLPEILKTLVDYQYDGINLGNTSTNYAEIRTHLHGKMREMFDYFTSNFGGGVGGYYLKHKSLLLCGQAVELLRDLNHPQEFHVIRTGGVENIEDIKLSEQVGVALNQWYSGYFINYIKYGDKIYTSVLCQDG